MQPFFIPTDIYFLKCKDRNDSSGKLHIVSEMVKEIPERFSSLLSSNVTFLFQIDMLKPSLYIFDLLNRGFASSLAGVHIAWQNNKISLLRQLNYFSCKTVVRTVPAI